MNAAVRLPFSARLCWLWPVLILGCALLQQPHADSLVVPAAFANKEDDGQSGVLRNPMRMQEIYSAAQFPPGPLKITELRFRRDAGVPPTITTIGRVTFQLCTTRKEPDGLSRTFSENTGTDVVVVFEGNLPISSTEPGPGEGPNPFDIVVHFSTPFVYDPTEGNLLLDILNESGSLLTHVDASNDPADGASRAFSLNPGASSGNADTGADIVQFVYTLFGLLLKEEPQGGQITTREPLELRVVASGAEPLSYQWLKDGMVLPGATNAVYRKESPTPQDSGEYTVLVRNPYGEVASTGATWTVERFGRPAVFINGLPLAAGQGQHISITVTNEAQVRLETAFSGGFIFYTLDGGLPTVVSTEYEGPLLVRETAQLRAVAYSADFVESAEADTLTLIVLPLFPVQATTDGGGTVRLLPPEGAYASNSVVRATAQADVGWTFLGWQGDSADTNTDLEITVSAPLRLKAVFGTLLTATPVGAGSLVVSPAREFHPYGSRVVVQAIPAAGNYFVRWGGSASGFASPLFVRVTNAVKNLTAVFMPLGSSQESLTVLVEGVGMVTNQPAKNVFTRGDTVTLTAVTESGSVFSGWSGDASGPTNSLALVMDSSKTVTARFDSGYRLFLVATHGRVLPEPERAFYDTGTLVRLTPVPDTGFVFRSWSVDTNSTQSTIEVVMNRDWHIAAQFEDVQPPEITCDILDGTITASEHVVLSGHIRDNVAVSVAAWERGGTGVSALTLSPDGRFEVSGLALARGDNLFAIMASDPEGNTKRIELHVVWRPARVLAVGDVPEQREGRRLAVPIELRSHSQGEGDVGGMSFALRYDAQYLKDPWLEWSSFVGASANTVNTNVPGQVRATFSMAGAVIPGGTQLLARVNFRVRSVPFALETLLEPDLVDMTDSHGNQLLEGSDFERGIARISPRRVKADNNGNDRLDVGDATLIQRMVTGLDSVRAWDVTGNDLNESDDLDSGDVTKVLRVVVGLDPQPAFKTAEARKRSGLSSKTADRPAPVAARLDLAAPLPSPPVSICDTTDSLGLPGYATPATDESAILSPGVLTAQVGQQVRVRVVLTNLASSIAGVSFRIEYPAAALQEAGHANGPFVPGGVVSLWNAEEPGVVVFAASGAWDWTQGGGLLAELVFNVLPGITAQTSWPISLIAVEVTADGFENRTLATRGATVGGETVAHPRIIVGESGMVSAGFEVVFQGQAGMQYDLQRSEDLEQWSDVTQVFGISDEMRVIDWGAAGRPAGFYRVHRRQ